MRILVQQCSIVYYTDVNAKSSLRFFLVTEEGRNYRGNIMETQIPMSPDNYRHIRDTRATNPRSKL